MPEPIVEGKTRIPAPLYDRALALEEDAAKKENRSISFNGFVVKALDEKVRRDERKGKKTK